MRYFCLISHTLIGYCTLVCTYLASYYNGNMYHIYQHIHKQHIHTHKHILHLPSKHIIVWSLKGAVLPSSLFTSQRCFYVSGATESSGSISVFFLSSMKRLFCTAYLRPTDVFGFCGVNF